MKNLFLAFTFLLSLAGYAENQITDLPQEVQEVFGSELELYGSEKEYKAIQILAKVYKDKLLPFHNHDRPKNKTKFYIACDAITVQLYLGYEWGSCVAYSMSKTGKVEYIPVSKRVARFGNAVGFTRSANVIELKEVDNLWEVDSLYLLADSGFAISGGLEVNWFLLGTNKTLSALDFDSEFGFYGNVFSIGIMNIFFQDNPVMNTLYLPYSKSLIKN